ncbi:Quino protein alcohol dehydrogenase-like protein [Coniochaeta ligniaria NRRL 30616]|uniref:Quino protein alcohol dehydrogenase-like protein n=1 Tax=Coniochaeta ligniaria NRRL 30616 TaxID=1408157 RepID=A0A1J7JNI3_9PEZI|nr:Quino protein alcohol dehydrogenase-like protein [Coniochaeta ligniaria NRRL 30616]
MGFSTVRLLAVLLQSTSIFQTVCADASASDVSSIVPEDPWNGWGANTRNDRFASSNRKISSSTIKSLSVHCQIPVPGGVSANPTIVQGIAYFPTWNGSLFALDYSTCKVKWQINVTQIIVDFKPLALPSDYTFVPASRTSPQLDLANNVIYFGTLTWALMVAADLSTGKVLGLKQINPHPFAINTVSPTLYGGIIYTGASSTEESAITAVAGYKCCSFVGNAVALKFSRQTGKFATIWDVPMLPADDPKQPGAWSGAAIWGSEPSIDAGRRQVFYATGNVYTVPDAYLLCLTNSTTKSSSKCLPDRVWQESVLAIDLYSGKVNWVRHLSALDAWTTACNAPVNTELCPGTPGVDADFGMAPAFVPGGGKGGKDVIVLGQKNGNLYSIRADNGAVQWATAVGPGSTSGGLSWGVAVDGKNVYFTEINAFQAAWTPQPANNTVITNSAYGSASLLTGTIVWETPVPNNMISTTPPTAVGDLILTGRSSLLSFDVTLTGGLVALKRATGDVLFDFPLDTYSQAGISVYDKYIFVGSGYHALVPGSFYVLSTEV